MRPKKPEAPNGVLLSSSPARKARKRGGKTIKRGLSDEQVPFLVAADRSGATVCAVLLAGKAEALRARGSRTGHGARMRFW